MAGSVPDLPGVVAPPEGARDIMSEVMHLLNRSKAGFPGAQPVSFSRKHIDALMSKNFLVCEKSDGLRCLMLLSQLFVDDGSAVERIYLITRNCEVSWVQNLHVPSERGNPRPFQVGTLIDGELVRSFDGKIRYFMFDLLAHQGKVLTDRNLEKRLGYLDQLVFRPFANFCNHAPTSAASFDFKIYMKSMSQSYRLDSVLSQKREHLSDGLIFTSVPDPYVYGTDPYIMKWKPASENSVDFAIRLDFAHSDDPTVDTDYYSKPNVTLLVWEGKTERDYGTLFISDNEWEAWKALEEPLNYRIVEVVQETTNQGEKRWRFLRFRDDKDHGNHVDIVSKVLESINDSLSLEELAEYIPAIREKWKLRDASLKRPRHDSNEGSHKRALHA